MLFARGLICVCAAYYITITFVQIFICRPIAKAYDPRIPGRCLDTKRIFISNTAIAIVSDVVVLAAPIPVIWKLNMGVWRRLGSIAALAAGGMYVQVSHPSNATMEKRANTASIGPVLRQSHGLSLC